MTSASRLGLPSNFQAIGNAGVTAELHGDVVIAYPRGRLQIDNRLSLGRIGESYIATFEAILVPVERDISFQNFHPSENCRTVGGAAHPEIRVAGEPGNGRLHLQFRSRQHVNIEFEAALQTIVLRQDGCLPALLDIGSEVKSWSYG